MKKGDLFRLGDIRYEFVEYNQATGVLRAARRPQQNRFEENTEGKIFSEVTNI